MRHTKPSDAAANNAGTGGTLSSTMPQDRDEERVKIDLDPETALRALLEVDPKSEPPDEAERDKRNGRRDASVNDS